MLPLIQKGEAVINRILAMDPEARDELSQYHGRCLAVIVTGTAYAFHVTISDSGIRLESTAETEPDVVVRGTPAEFMAFLRSVPGGAQASGSIEISGNVRLAQEIQAVLKRLQPDWEEQLSHWIGDSPAHTLGNLARLSARFLADTGETLRADVSEYLIYEKDILPESSELEEFNAAVDTLRNDVERLRVRIDRLQRGGKT